MEQLLIIYSLAAESWTPILVGVIGGLGAALVTTVGSVLVVKRRESGSIKPSNASDLWSAYDKLMERVTQDNTKLRERVSVLEAQVKHLEDELKELRGTNE